MTCEADQLPRLLYLGDVPVRSTLAGSALLYRLLWAYPRDRLRIIETNAMPADGPVLQGVAYQSLRVCNPRLLRTRFGHLYRRYLYHAAPFRGWVLARKLKAGDWCPQAVVTVVHDHTWRSAVVVAEKLGVPLHLIIHDDVYTAVDVGPKNRSKFQEMFSKIYAGAASRFCISPYMAELYKRDFGREAQVMYPTRAVDGPRFDAPPLRLGEASASLTFAYAGSLNTTAYVQMLKMFADVLAKAGHRLLVYSTLSPASAAAAGLQLPNVTVNAVVPFKQLIDILRQRVDALFLPMSFTESDRQNMMISFPSKLTDYTAAGLPLLVQGPGYCSAVRWALENPGVAEVVSDLSPAALEAAVARLKDSSHRLSLAHRAIDVGGRYFSQDFAFETFADTLQSAQRGS
jgi:hypothetical protein